MSGKAVFEKYGIMAQVLFIGALMYGYSISNWDMFRNCAFHIVRYLLYVMIFQGVNKVYSMAVSVYQTKEKPEMSRLLVYKPYYVLFGGCVALLLYSKENLLTLEFPVVYFAQLVLKYPELETASASINYGVGMACSYIEGYIRHVIPDDGTDCTGFHQKMLSFESSQVVIFPVKKLFIIITKSLYCPPTLEEFNKPNNPDLPQLEACRPLGEVSKDVAGVKDRRYRSTAYVIRRRGKPSVYVVAECATPLHTLYRVFNSRALYAELCNANRAEIAADFCRMITKVLDSTPEFKGRCELVYFDEEDPTQNLASVLLEKIYENEPDFERIILTPRQ